MTDDSDETVESKSKPVYVEQNYNKEKVTFYGADITSEMVSTVLLSENMNFRAIRQFKKGQVVVYTEDAASINQTKWNSALFNGALVWTRRPNEEIPPTRGWVSGTEFKYTNKELAKATGAVKVLRRPNGLKLIYGSPQDLYQATLMGANLPEYKRIVPWIAPPRDCRRCGSLEHFESKCTALLCEACKTDECLDSKEFCSIRRSQIRSMIPERRSLEVDKLKNWIQNNQPDMIVKNKKESVRVPHVKTTRESWPTFVRTKNIKRKQRPQKKSTPSQASRSPEIKQRKTNHSTPYQERVEKILTGIKANRICPNKGSEAIDAILEAEKQRILFLEAEARAITAEKLATMDFKTEDVIDDDKSNQDEPQEIYMNNENSTFHYTTQNEQGNIVSISLKTICETTGSRYTDLFNPFVMNQLISQGNNPEETYRIMTDYNQGNYIDTMIAPALRFHPDFYKYCLEDLHMEGTTIWNYLKWNTQVLSCTQEEWTSYHAYLTNQLSKSQLKAPCQLTRAGGES